MLEELESMASLSPLLKMVGVLRAADMYWNPDRLNLFLFLIEYMYLFFLHATFVYGYQNLSKICTYIALMHFFNRATGNCI